MQDEMYKKAAGAFANELYDELINSEILDDKSILCNHTVKDSASDEMLRDKNFLLWSLIPYIAAYSGGGLMDNGITFEEVATIRRDGGHNIFHASVVADGMTLPDDYVYMKNWCGPMWNGNGKNIFWQIDSQWSDRGFYPGMRPSYDEEVRRVLSLYEHESEWLLSKEDYAWLAERGYIKTWGEYDGCFKTSWKIVVLTNKEIKDKLLSIGDRIKAKYKSDFEAFKIPYAEAVLRTVPAHLKRVKEYELQFVFHSDGWFLLHCVVALLNSGKLTLPTDEQKKSLMTMIVPD